MAAGIHLPRTTPAPAQNTIHTRKIALPGLQAGDFARTEFEWYMPRVKVLPSDLPLPHDQHFYSVLGEEGSLRGPYGPFSLDELRQEFSALGLGPSDIQNFLDQIGTGNPLELEVPHR